MKSKGKATKKPRAATARSRHVAVAANRATGGPLQVNVSAAKDRLSELLEVASRGDEVVITSDGKPKARLVPATRASKPFEVDWEWLKSMPIRSGKTAEEVVREDRAGRF